MTKKILLGTLAGGIAVFLVGGIWHMLSGLGEVGVKSLPNEDVVMAAMRASIHEPGFYFFPGANMAPGRSKQQMQTDQAAYLEKYKQGPNGIVIYHPGGEEFRFGKLLVNEFLIDLAGAFLAACILALGAGAMGYWPRVLVVTLLGLFAGVFFALQYWNWYGFPTNYTIIYILGGVADWGGAGLVMAAIVKRPATA
jgi:hypothetical protein